MSTFSRVTRTLALIVGTALPGPLLGQSTVAIGERLRVHQYDGSVFVGVLQADTREEIRLIRAGDSLEVSIPKVLIEEVEYSRGRKRRFARNFGLTVLVSAVLFGSITALEWSPCVSTEPFGCLLASGSRAEAFKLGMAGGAVIGVPVGLIVGMSAQSEEWASVDPNGESAARPPGTLEVVPQIEMGLSIPLGF